MLIINETRVSLVALFYSSGGYKCLSATFTLDISLSVTYSLCGALAFMGSFDCFKSAWWFTSIVSKLPSSFRNKTTTKYFSVATILRIALAWPNEMGISFLNSMVQEDGTCLISTSQRIFIELV